jgi:CBS-domain-containing membrane protein
MMTERRVDVCLQAEISDDDVYAAMSEISGFVDVTPGHFKELYAKAYAHALRRLARRVSVKDVMNTDVAYVRVDTSLAEAATLMAQRGVSGVPVLDGRDNVVGVISEKDFMRIMSGAHSASFMHVIAECLGGRRCLAVPVNVRTAADIMSAPAVTVTPEATLMEAADLMAKRGVNRTPVTDDRGRLVGIVSRGDVVSASLVG